VYKQIFGLIGIFVVSYFAIRFRELGGWIPSIVSLVLFALPLFFSIPKDSYKKFLLVFLVLSLLGWGFELLSITKGIPYGFFIYGPNLGPKLLDLVPYALPLSWPVIVLSVSNFFAGKIKPLYGILIGSLILLAIDLVLDPVAVRTGMWKYAQNGLYYGVPFSNFLGWLVSGATGLWVVSLSKLNLKPTSRYTVAIHITFWTGCAVWLGLWIPVGIGVSLLGAYFVLHSNIKY
jgi:bisanhydrobacterioruberin hydratase